MLIRRFFAFVVSLFILFSLPINAANAASAWSITSAVSAGSRSIVSATKSGYKSAVNIAPSVGKVAGTVLKRGNQAYLIYAIAGLIGDGIDYTLDPANNRVIYKPKAGAIPDNYIYILDGNRGTYNTFAEAYARMQQDNPNYHLVESSRDEPSHTGLTLYYSKGGNLYGQIGNRYPDMSAKYLSAEAVAAQVIKNANAGHTDSQQLTRGIATEMVIGGQFDQDLLSGAVPTSDTKPLIPAVPGNGNGNVTHGESWEGGDSMSGATPGQQSDAAKDAADAAKKAAAAAKDAAKAAQDAARDAADKAQDLVNAGADAAAQAAAQAAAAAAAQAAKDAAASAAAAGDKSAAQAAAAERAAAAATAAAKAAAEKAAKDLAAAIAAGEQAAIDAAKAATEAAAKELAEAKEKQAAAEKAADRAKAEAAKPFELPAFCTWAAPVCDFINWFKEPPPADVPAGDVPFATTGDVGLDDVDRFEKRITFSGQCPSNDFSFSMMGVTYAKPIPYHHLCGFLEQIAPWLLAMCYLGTAYFVVENI